MPKTVQIRDLDDETYRVLATRAGRDGISVPEYLRREAKRLAELPDTLEWLERVDRIPSSGVTTQMILDTLDAVRGNNDDGR